MTPSLPLQRPRLGLGTMMLAWILSMAFLAMDWFAGRWMSWTSEWLIGIWGCFPVAVYAFNRVSLSSVRVTRAQVPAWGYKGQPLQAQVGVVNASGRWSNGVDVVLGAHTAVASGAHAHLLLPFPWTTRGHHAWPGLVVRSGFPFGFFLLSRSTSSLGTSWIYPALEPRAPAWPAHAAAPAKASRSGEDVLTVREYVVGDPMRLVDWKASARKGGWVVKEFEHEGVPSLTFSWEQVHELGLEEGVERLAAWVTRAHKQGLRYGLVLGEEQTGLDRTEEHYHACMRALAGFEGVIA